MLKNISYNYMLFSQEDKTLNSAAYLGIASKKLSNIADLCISMVDAYTAIALFYHDYSQDPELLKRILETPAFYIGAQGSYKAQSARMQCLKELGVDKNNRDRICGPIGLIPSTRDPQSLAVSVLAEIVAFEKSKFGADKY